MKRIVLCGTFRGEGYKIFQQSVIYCNHPSRLPRFFPDTRVCLTTDIYPAADPNDPDEIREASRKALQMADGAIVVFLSRQTLGLPEPVDIIGGPSVEVGVLLASKEYHRWAILFENEELLDALSTLLKPGTKFLSSICERTGDMDDLNKKVFHLALSIRERLSQ